MFHCRVRQVLLVYCQISLNEDNHMGKVKKPTPIAPAQTVGGRGKQRKVKPPKK